MIAIGTDHGGFELKNCIVEYFLKNNIEFKDFGAHSLDNLDDYPDYTEKVCKAIRSGECDKGIVICGAGIGSAIAANKFKGIRAALCNDLYSARVSREHNNANVLALGGRIIGKEIAIEIVKIWLSTDFLGGKHQRRIDKFTVFEDK